MLQFYKLIIRNVIYEFYAMDKITFVAIIELLMVMRGKIAIFLKHTLNYLVTLMEKIYR